VIELSYSLILYYYDIAHAQFNSNSSMLCITCSGAYQWN